MMSAADLAEARRLVDEALKSFRRVDEELSEPGESIELIREEFLAVQAMMSKLAVLVESSTEPERNVLTAATSCSSSVVRGLTWVPGDPPVTPEAARGAVRMWMPGARENLKRLLEIWSETAPD